VRYLFQRYGELGTVCCSSDRLKRRGIVSKVWTSSSGKRRGGLGYSRGALYHLLRIRFILDASPIRGASYGGQHPGIVPQDLWDRVQAMLTENARAAHDAGSSEPCCCRGSWSMIAAMS